MTEAFDLKKWYKDNWIGETKEWYSSVTSGQDNTQFDDMFESDSREGEKLKK